jgi:HEAT repeat protein
MASSLEFLHALTDTLVAFADPAAAQGDRIAALRTAARAARHRGLEMSHADRAFVVNGTEVPMALLERDGVVRAMRAHGIQRLVVRRHAGARDIAQLIGLLAREPAGTPLESGVTLARELDELRLWSVRIVPTEAPSDAPLPEAVETALAAFAAGPPSEADARAQALVDALTAAVRQEPAQRARVVAHALARAMAAAQAGGQPAVGHALRTHAATVPVLVALADAVVSPDARTREHGLAVFHAAGAAGPQGLVALLASASTIRQRRRCFDALIAIGDGVPALMTALADPQWYVVRNAAQLLGELRAAEASEALERTLVHADARVRLAAAVALEQIDTPAARAALQAVVTDDSPEVRRIAARAFVSEDAAPTQPAVLVARLIATLDRETDAETLVELIRALGAIGTPDTIQRLLRLLSPSAHPPQATPVRLAALEALVQARGSAAAPMLRELRQDRDPSVRAAARQYVTAVAA